MAKINVAGLQDVKPEALLANSRYSLEITNAKQLDKADGNRSLAVNYRITMGVTQQDGSSPEDRRLSDFFPLTGFENMKDGGTFCKRKLREFLDAVGVEVDQDGNFDPEELPLKRVDGLTRNKENKELGVMETSIVRYLKTA
jgi:hypothetical protein